MLAAILDEWREDLRYRVSRVKSRLKFMIDDIGPEGLRARIESRLGRTFEDFALPQLPPARNHLGVHEQADGRHYVGVPVHLGLISGDQMIALADLAESLDGDVRLTRQQNLVLTNVAPDRLEDVVAALAAIDLPLDAGALRGDAVACTGEPHCNFSVTETKTRMDGLVQLLETRFGKDADGLRMNLDGCPHACAHHSGRRDRLPGNDGARCRGEAPAGLRRLSPRRPDRPGPSHEPSSSAVPTEELDDAVVGLVGGWVGARGDGETFRMFCERLSDDELGRLAGREPAKAGEDISCRAVGRSRGGGARGPVRGRRARGRARVGNQRFSPSLSISTAFETDGAVLLHMAYAIDPAIRMFSVDREGCRMRPSS